MRKTSRFMALDELRALAVMSMCIAHFAPGVVVRVPKLQSLGEPLALIGRFSTVAFVISFGLTLGFIQFPRWIAGKQQRVVDWLLRRAWLLAICAGLISVPAYIVLWLNGKPDSLATWAFASYNVLNYYVLAMISAPLWLRMLQRDTAVRSVLLAALHWMAFALLIGHWHFDADHPWLEFIRLQLISGGYAYLPLAATSLLAIPLGRWLQQCVADGTSLAAARRFVALGVVVASLGFVLGLMGDMSAAAIANGSVKGPARLWYWMLFGGTTLVCVGCLVTLHVLIPNLARATWPLALFGQAALGVYTTRGWVLPIVGALDHVVVIEGKSRAVLALAIFASFCALSMWHYARKNANRRNKVSESTLLPSASAGKFWPGPVGSNSSGWLRL